MTDISNSNHVEFNVLQWNAQSLRPKLLDFEQLLIQSKIHIAAICETWLDPESLIKISNYNIFRNDRQDSYGGVCIFTHKSVQAQRLDIVHPNEDIQILHVKVSNCKNIENIVAVYCPQWVQTRRVDWDIIFGKFCSKSLVLGDYNAHHFTWSYKTDVRGSQIYDAITDCNLVSLNDGSYTRIKLVANNLQQSSPDISFCTSDIACVFNWQVTNESLGSDHLVVKISSSIACRPNLLNKRNFKLADWSAYTSQLEEDFSNFVLSGEPQSIYDNFLHHINRSADAHIPKLKINLNPSSKFTPKPYWSPVLSESVARRRLALSQFRKNPTPSNMHILKDCIAKSQKLLRKAVSGNWHKFCDSVDETSSASEMWRKMKWLKGNQVQNCSLDESKSYTLLCSLCPAYVPHPRPTFNANNSKLECPITLHELETCIKTTDTAPGCDNITFSMIKKLPQNGKNILLAIYNNFLSTGFTPSQWRDICVVPIPKPGRDPSLASSFRPISLMSCICKIFHSIINRRLEWYFENKGIFSNEMVGFRKSKSCIDSLVRLVTRVQSGFSKDLVTLACFLDIDNAYNNVNICSLLEILDRAGIGQKICKYLWNFLSLRNLKIRQGHRYVCRSTGQGLAQGDPLSPLLFNVATHHICNAVQNVFVSQYADDFALYSTDKNIDSARRSLQDSLNILVGLLENLGLSVSPTKSKMCIFKKGNNRDTVHVTIGGAPLQEVDNVRYLGMWLDRSLRWGKHVNEIIQKTHKSLNILKILAGSGWGVHPKHLRRLYIALIRSRLDFGSFLYSSCSKSNLVKLNKLQNQALRIIGGFVKTTPIHVMESELCMPPLHIRRIFLAGKYCLRSMSLSNNITIEVLSELNSLISHRYWRRRQIPILVQMYLKFKQITLHSAICPDMYALDYWVNWYDLNNVVKIHIEGINQAKRKYDSTNLRQSCALYLESQYSSHYKIFTDGSKNTTVSTYQGAMGAAFFDSQTDSFMKFKICNNMSIMYLELLAILEALSYIKSIDYNKFVILTDSKSSLQHVARCTSCLRGTPIAYDIIRTIWELRSYSKEVILQWIPSHIGLVGNERVDRLAKEASCDGVPISTLPFFTDFIYLVKEHCYQLWKVYFDERSVEKGIWYRTLQNEPWKSPWFEDANLNRNYLVIALRLRSGHIPLNKFAFLMQKVPSPLCTECGVVEDVIHIMLECVRNEDFRFGFFRNDIYFISTGGCNTVLAYPLSKKAKLLFKMVEIGMRRRKQ